MADVSTATARPYRRQDVYYENFPSLFSRYLAGGGDENDDLDYTVFSVAAMTLGIILCVELVRHRLDVAATGRPFFKSVLESVYRECK